MESNGLDYANSEFVNTILVQDLRGFDILLSQNGKYWYQMFMYPEMPVWNSESYEAVGLGSKFFDTEVEAYNEARDNFEKVFAELDN